MNRGNVVVPNRQMVLPTATGGADRHVARRQSGGKKSPENLRRLILEDFLGVHTYILGGALSRLNLWRLYEGVRED